MIVRNGHGDKFKIMDKDNCISNNNTLRKSMHPTILLPDIDKYQGRPSSLILTWQPVKKKEN